VAVSYSVKEATFANTKPWLDSKKAPNSAFVSFKLKFCISLHPYSIANIGAVKQ